MLVSWFVEYMISGEIFYASFGYNACPKHIDYMQWMNQQTILFIYLFICYNNSLSFVYHEHEKT